jgi:hypothetical protein
MDHYHIWCNLIDGTQDLQFCEDVRRYLGHLQEQGLIERFRITRRKLGLGPAELGEFHITIETQDLAQLERAFQQVATRAGEVEALHQAVYSAVKDVRFGLYRDFPDGVRVSGDGSAGAAGRRPPVRRCTAGPDRDEVQR